MSEPLLQIRDLSVSFGRGASEVVAARAVDLQVAAGETVALVGESGWVRSAVTGSA